MTKLEIFNHYRSYLFAIAYRMLGSVMDAEDMVQEAFLRWQQTPPAQVETPKAFLATVVTRLCLDFLKSARVQREQYVGPWLPEPLPTDAAVFGETALSGEGAAILSESISIAFLVLLENLSANERAAFLLREVFEYRYRDLAAVMNKSEAACRQLVRRARQHLRTNQPQFRSASAESEELAAEFFQACFAGDMTKLLSLLAEDVVEWSDGGGQIAAARKPVIGREKVARFMLGLARQAPPGFTAQFKIFNGQTGIQINLNGRPFSVAILDIREGKIQKIYSIVNPDKLRHIAASG